MERTCRDAAPGAATLDMPRGPDPASAAPDAGRARRALAGLALAGLAAWAAPGLAQAQSPDARPAQDAAATLAAGPQLRADGMPPLRRVSPRPAAAPRVLRFVDWHPLQAEMLVVAQGRAEDGGAPQLHRLREAGGRPQPLTRERHTVQRGLWEPLQGDYVVFSRDTDGNEAWRLFRTDAEGRGPAVPLSPAHLRVADYAFLPEGRGLAVLLTTLDRQPPRPPAPEEGGISDDDTPEAAAATAARALQSELWVIDPLRPEQPPQVLVRVRQTRLGDLRVLPDGDLALLHTDARGSQVWRHPWRGGTALRLAQGGGEAPAEGAEGGAGVLWLRAVQGDFRQLQRVDLRSGRRSLPLPGTGADLEAVAVPAPGPAPRPLALVHNVQGVSVLGLFDPEDRSAALRQPAGVPPGVIGGIGWHPRLPLLAFNHVSTQSPGRPWVLDLARGEAQPWAAGAAPAGQVLPELRTLRWKSFDGLEITALHVPPPARFAGPRPVFIDIHGGPTSQARPAYLQGLSHHVVHVLGMHLVQPNVRGSEGFGRRFRDLDNGRRREDAVRDIGSLLDLVAAQPEMDAARVVVSGGSYGGYMALAVAAAESPRILGAISRVGISHFVTLLENTESYRRDNRRQEYGDERDPAMRAFLDGIAPLHRAAAMRKPMFIVHGRNDPRVPWSEAAQMVAALRAHGTPVWFLTAENEGHGFARADNREYLFHATVEFVQRLLDGRAIDDRP